MKAKTLTKNNSYWKSMKSFVMTSTVGLLTSFVNSPRVEATNFKPAEITSNIVTIGNPNSFVLGAGAGFDGVVGLRLNTGGDGFGVCTGSLLSTGLHILTAAHCLTDTSGNLLNINSTSFAVFELTAGFTTLSFANFFIHPDWNGNLLNGNDIAIIELATLAPTEAERYNIYRDTNEVNQNGTKVGYGLTGNGNTGVAFVDGRKRAGENRYDALADIFDGLLGTVTLGTQLAYDFDNGNPANDALGVLFGLNNTGLPNEVSIAPGDSGGPTFINGLIGGVASYGFGFPSFPGSPDVKPGTNASFGEIAVDTRVSYYASWIDGVLEEPEPVPEPAATAGLLLLGAGFALTRRTPTQKKLDKDGRRL